MSCKEVLLAGLFVPITGAVVSWMRPDYAAAALIPMIGAGCYTFGSIMDARAKRCKSNPAASSLILNPRTKKA